MAVATMASAVLKVLKTVATMAMAVIVPVATTVVSTTASTTVTVVASVTASVVYVVAVTSASVAANMYHSRRRRMLMIVAPISEPSYRLESVIVADAAEVPVRADSYSH